MIKTTEFIVILLSTVWILTACGPMGSQMGKPQNLSAGMTTLPDDYQIRIEQEFERLKAKAEQEMAEAHRRKEVAEQKQQQAEQERLESEKAEEKARLEQEEAERAEKEAIANAADAKKAEDARKQAEAETKRAEAEAKKKKAESERLAAETKKKEAEEKKKQAEEERLAAEDAEKKAQDDLAEAQRKKQEALEVEKRRKEAEARKKADEDRLAAEKKQKEEKEKNITGKSESTKPQVTPPTDVRTDMTGFSKLVWEKDRHAGPQAKEWTKMVYAIIEQEEPQYLGQNVAKDIERFCPKYRSMPDAQRLNFWGQFIAALSLPESSWIPTTQMVETTQGIDPVTKQRVKSEGLLQLSYQDERSYKIDCGFDWEKDKLLPEKDPRRTILNPYLNLRCGIKILAIQLKNRGSITLESNVYWAVLKINGKYSRIAQISATTRAVNGCQ